MFRYVVIDEQEGLVRATIETPDELIEPDSSYHPYESLNTAIPFDELSGCLYSSSGLSKPPAPVEPTEEELEILWRNNEIDYVDSKSFAPDFPYMEEVKAYKQELRDYPDKEGFPSCDRPVRPLTPKGQPIIT